MFVPFTAATPRDPALQWLAGMTLFLSTILGAIALLKNRLQASWFSWTSAKTVNYKTINTKSDNLWRYRVGRFNLRSQSSLLQKNSFARNAHLTLKAITIEYRTKLKISEIKNGQIAHRKLLARNYVKSGVRADKSPG